MAGNIRPPTLTLQQHLVPRRLSELTAHDGMIIYGRSGRDAEPGGVRIGTAEIHRQVEQLPKFSNRWSSARTGCRARTTTSASSSLSSCREGHTLDAGLIERVKRTIKDNTTPRHVPAKGRAGARTSAATKSGKIVELAVRNGA